MLDTDIGTTPMVLKNWIKPYNLMKVGFKTFHFLLPKSLLILVDFDGTVTVYAALVVGNQFNTKSS